MANYFALLVHESLNRLMWHNIVEGLLCSAQCLHESEEAKYMGSFVSFALDSGYLGTECSY